MKMLIPHIEIWENSDASDESWEVVGVFILNSFFDLLQKWKKRLGSEFPTEEDCRLITNILERLEKEISRGEFSDRNIKSIKKKIIETALLLRG